jgi:hypothetical protein
VLVVIGHIISVYFLPRVRSFTNLFYTAFDWQKYPATTFASGTILFTIIIGMLSFLRAKPSRKYGIPWNIWKVLHYLLYIGYFGICAHVIERATKYFLIY